MKNRPVRKAWYFALPLLLLAAVSCSTSKATRPYKEPPPPDFHSKVIPYTEEEAFDTLLESLLVNQEPVVIIATEFQKPEWGPRLNAWIAAWNMGGKVDVTGDGRKLRGQLPGSPVVVNEGSLREFRLLVHGLMDRVEDLARDGSAWWAEEKVKSRRVALLKSYNLRFHLDEKNNIQLILFNGLYSQYYKDYVHAIAQADADEPDEFRRDMPLCSRCKQHRFQNEEAGPPDAIRLTGWVGERRE